MSRPAQAKYCPECGTMNFTDAEHCVRCGHQFRTGLSAPLTDGELHKTQMFLLPPLTQRPVTEEAPPQAAGRFAHLKSRLTPLRPAPHLLTAAGLMAAAAAALLCWAAFGGIWR